MSYLMGKAMFLLSKLSIGSSPSCAGPPDWDELFLIESDVDGSAML